MINVMKFQLPLNSGSFEPARDYPIERLIDVKFQLPLNSGSFELGMDDSQKGQTLKSFSCLLSTALLNLIIWNTLA